MSDFYNDVESGISMRLFSGMKDPFFTNPKTHRVEEWHVSDNDSNLALGGDYFLIFRPGSFSKISTDYNSGEIQTIDWETIVRLYVRYIEKSEQWALLKPFRAEVIRVVMKYRFLDVAIIGGDSIPQVLGVDRVRSIVPTEPAGYFWFLPNAREQGLPPNFMYQPLQITTRQRVKFD